jgi:hypothetical protein
MTEDIVIAEEGVQISKFRQRDARKDETGYEPSESRDAPLHPHLGIAPLPTEYVLPYFDQITVRDQGNRPTCVAEAARTIREYLALRGGVAARLSMAYLYLGAKALDGNPSDGTTPEMVFAVLLATGTPHEPSCPDDATTTTQVPVIEAAAFKISSVSQVDATTIQEVLFEQQQPVLLGVELQEDSFTNSNFMWPDTAPYVGGHALVIYGWRTDADGSLHYLIRNSWGANWGDEGNGSISANHPLLEAWVLHV